MANMEETREQESIAEDMAQDTTKQAMKDENSDPEQNREQKAPESEAAEQEAAEEEAARQEGAEEEVSSGKEKKEKKKKEKKEKKDKKDEQIEELTDRLKRSMAEFDNYRKRVEREKSHMYEIGAKDVIEKILPVIDNFERGFAGILEEEIKADPFMDGMDKVFKQMLTCLEEIGVKQIEALEKEFDPNFHNAVMHVDDENLGENIIVEEFQKGYTYKDSVVRHSMVKVAN